MISRMYRVEVERYEDDGVSREQVEEAEVYKGFDMRYSDAPFIALVWEDDTPVFWALDDDGPAVQQLQSFLDASIGRIGAVYRNTGLQVATTFTP